MPSNKDRPLAQLSPALLGCPTGCGNGPDGPAVGPEPAAPGTPQLAGPKVGDPRAAAGASVKYRLLWLLSAAPGFAKLGGEPFGATTAATSTSA